MEANPELELRNRGANDKLPPRVFECGRRTDKIFEVRSSFSKKTLSFHLFENEPRKSSSEGVERTELALLWPALLLVFAFPMAAEGGSVHEPAAAQGRFAFISSLGILLERSGEEKMSLSMPYWLNQQVGRAGNWSPLCPICSESAK